MKKIIEKLKVLRWTKKLSRMISEDVKEKIKQDNFETDLGVIIAQGEIELKDFSLGEEAKVALIINLEKRFSLYTPEINAITRKDGVCFGYTVYIGAMEFIRTHLDL